LETILWSRTVTRCFFPVRRPEPKYCLICLPGKFGQRLFKTLMASLKIGSLAIAHVTIGSRMRRAKRSMIFAATWSYCQAMRYSIDILRPLCHCALIKTQLSRNLCGYRLAAGSRRNVDSDDLGIPGEIKSVQPGEIISGIVGDIERNQQVPKNSNFSLTDPQFNLRLPRMRTSQPNPARPGL